ncbi:hypothetical protein K4K48_013099 [Colletotrichum sp. SAR 10_66]|nr:hypothetical protein K4K48_013099 [Colletotrichum sp. SAR 10_66]
MPGESSQQRQETPEVNDCIFVVSTGFPVPARRSPLPTSAPMPTGVDDNEGAAPKETERVGPPSPCKGDQKIKEGKPKDDAIPADEDEGIVVAAPEPGTNKKPLPKDEGIAT